MTTNPNKSAKQFDLEMFKKMVPFEKCQTDVAFIQIDDTEEDLQSIHGFHSNTIWQTIDSDVKTKGGTYLNQILCAIYKTRFLEPITQLKINYENILKGISHSIYGKILITDAKSRALLSDIINLKILKEEPIGISCEYNIRDILPQERPNLPQLSQTILTTRCLTTISQ